MASIAQGAGPKLSLPPPRPGGVLPCCGARLLFAKLCTARPSSLQTIRVLHKRTIFAFFARADCWLLAAEREVRAPVRCVLGPAAPCRAILRPCTELVTDTCKTLVQSVQLFPHLYSSPLSRYYLLSIYLRNLKNQNS